MLVFSLVLALCSGLILAGSLGYVSYAARRSAVSATRSCCRLAAMSAIEKVKNDRGYHALITWLSCTDHVAIMH